MTAATVRRRVAATVEEAWSRVSDVVGHAPHVPLTSISLDEPLELGTTFVARTGIGPLGFADPMSITGWSPPPDPTPSLRLVKSGRLLDGWAEITVRPADGGAEVVWTEEIWPAGPLRPLSRPTQRLTGRATRTMLGRVLDGVLADLPALEDGGRS